MSPYGDGVLLRALLTVHHRLKINPSNTWAVLFTFPLGWQVTLLISKSEFNSQSTGHSLYFPMKQKFPSDLLRNRLSFSNENVIQVKKHTNITLLHGDRHFIKTERKPDLTHESCLEMLKETRLEVNTVSAYFSGSNTDSIFSQGMLFDNKNYNKLS